MYNTRTSIHKRRAFSFALISFESVYSEDNQRSDALRPDVETVGPLRTLAFTVNTRLLVESIL
jgi:hypothetical protein